VGGGWNKVVMLRYCLLINRQLLLLLPHLGEEGDCYSKGSVGESSLYLGCHCMLYVSKVRGC
jgi:hypothetical protein